MEIGSKGALDWTSGAGRPSGFGCGGRSLGLAFGGVLTWLVNTRLSPIRETSIQAPWKARDSTMSGNGSAHTKTQEFRLPFWD